MASFSITSYEMPLNLISMKDFAFGRQRIASAALAQTQHMCDGFSAVKQAAISRRQHT